MGKTCSIFLSFADEDSVFAEELDKHLAPLQRRGIISVWDRRKLIPGQSRTDAVEQHIQSANLILFIVSVDYLASEHCSGNDGDIAKALSRHTNKQSAVIPILARAVDWQSTSFCHLQPLPRDGNPVCNWYNRDSILVTIVHELKQQIECMSLTEKSNQIQNAKNCRNNKFSRRCNNEIGEGPFQSFDRINLRWMGMTAIGFLMALAIVLVSFILFREKSADQPIIVFRPSLSSGANEIDQTQWDTPADFIAKIQSTDPKKIIIEVSSKRDEERRELWRLVRALRKENDQLISAMRYLQSQAKVWQHDQRLKERSLAQIVDRIEAMSQPYDDASVVTPKYLNTSDHFDASMKTDTLSQSNNSTSEEHTLSVSNSRKKRDFLGSLRRCDCWFSDDILCGFLPGDELTHYEHGKGPGITHADYENCRTINQCANQIKTSCDTFHVDRHDATGLLSMNCLSSSMAQQVCRSKGFKSAILCQIYNNGKLWKMWECK